MWAETEISVHWDPFYCLPLSLLTDSAGTRPLPSVLVDSWISDTSHNSQKNRLQLLRCRPQQSEERRPPLLHKRPRKLPECSFQPSQRLHSGSEVKQATTNLGHKARKTKTERKWNQSTKHPSNKDKLKNQNFVILRGRKWQRMFLVLFFFPGEIRLDVLQKKKVGCHTESITAVGLVGRRPWTGPSIL